MGRVVRRRPVGNLDEQTARAIDEKREQMVGGDEVRLDREPEGCGALCRGRASRWVCSTPRGRRSGDPRPDVIHEHVELAVIGTDAIREPRDLGRIEVIHSDRDTRDRRAV